MKKIFVATLLVLTFQIGIFAQAELKVGDVAPDFTLTTITGETVSLKELINDKPVVLNFWATWCPPCVAEMPDLQKFADKNSSKVQVVGINAGEDLATVQGFIKTHKYKFPILCDLSGKVATNYKIYAIPQTFLIGQDGKIKAHRIGGMREKDFEKLLVVK